MCYASYSSEQVCLMLLLEQRDSGFANPPAAVNSFYIPPHPPGVQSDILNLGPAVREHRPRRCYWLGTGGAGGADGVGDLGRFFHFQVLLTGVARRVSAILHRCSSFWWFVQRALCQPQKNCIFI